MERVTEAIGSYRGYSDNDVSSETVTAVTETVTAVTERQL